MCFNLEKECSDLVDIMIQIKLVEAYHMRKLTVCGASEKSHFNAHTDSSDCFILAFSST